MDLVFDPAIGVEAFGFGDDAGEDFLASGGHFVDHGEVLVAVDGDRKGAGNRCGGHAEEVGRAVFFEGGALFDAEAVLFVDDGQSQFVESDGVLDQGMSTDDDLDAAEAEVVEDLVAVGFCCRSGEEGDIDFGEEFVEGLEMLSCENLGRCHHGCLIAVCNRVQSRKGGDDGFAGANIALDEAAHGERSGEVVGDFFEGADLGVGEAKWECLDKLANLVVLSSDGFGLVV